MLMLMIMITDQSSSVFFTRVIIVDVNATIVVPYVDIHYRIR